MFTIYNNLPMAPVWSPAIDQNAKITRALAGSTFGPFRSGLKTKQESFYSLTVWKDTVHITLMDALYGECSDIEEKAVFVINIHGKIVQ